jgi:hypothetical protein
MPEEFNNFGPARQTPVDPERMAEAQHAIDVGEIIEIGRKHFGTATFDEASDTVAKALGGGKIQHFMNIARQFDRPHELVNHLAGNERQLQELAKMSPARQIVELGRIEARMAPHGHVPTGADPLWKTPAVRNSRVSDEDWGRSYGEGMSDKAFDKEFWRRQEQRAKRR